MPENLPVLVSRPKEGAMLGGVCAGLARRWQVDPNLLRIAVAVLSFFGGLGLAAYASGLLLMPRDGQTEMPVRRYLPFTRTWSSAAVVAATIGAAVVLLGITGSSSFGVGPLVIIGLVWYFGFRNRGGHSTPLQQPEPTPFERNAAAWRERLAEQQVPGFENAVPPAPQAPPQLAAPAQVPPAVAASGQRWVQPYTEPVTELDVHDGELPAVVQRPNRRWRLWWLALSLAATGVLVVALLGLLGLPVAPLAYAAAVLAGFGLTLIFAARSGRPPLLLPATLVAAAVTASMLGPAPGSPPPGLGELRRAYAAGAELPPSVNWSAGDVAMDLSDLRLTGDDELDIHVGAGSVDLILPAGAASEVTWTVKAGGFAADGEKRSGLDISGVQSYPGRTPDAPTLRVRVSVDLGDVEVRR